MPTLPTAQTPDEQWSEQRRKMLQVRGYCSSEIDKIIEAELGQRAKLQEALAGRDDPIDMSEVGTPHLDEYN